MSENDTAAKPSAAPPASEPKTYNRPLFLSNHSYYSLRYGTLPVEKLIDQAKFLGINSLALTDINSSQGVMEFVKLSREAGIKPIAGIEFRNGNQWIFTAIARNNTGFREINQFLSDLNASDSEIPSKSPHFEHAFVIYPFGVCQPDQLIENEFVGLKPHELTRLASSEFKSHQDKLLCWFPVSFSSADDYELHLNLRAIANNTLLGKLKAEFLADPSEILISPQQWLKIFEDWPEMIQNTLNLTEQCDFQFDFRVPKNKKSFTGTKSDDKILLEKLSFDGLQYRYGKNNKVAEKRIRHELKIIDDLGFSAYFLITWDIIRYSMSRGFYHVGRGSGANSVVAYCLRITDVDPIELDLYFERFLNPKRSSPPDFDIDYSWKERDEVIDYIFKRYGHNYTALLGMTPTFKDRSIIRELGKVHGLPKEEIDRMIDYPEDAMNQNDIAKLILRIGEKMEHFPNIRSIHAGGILISEEPITAYTALDMPPKGFPTTQWDMYVAEDIGFEKLDILSQRGIGHIKDAVEIVRENQKVSVDVHAVHQFKRDQNIQRMLANAKTIGCFYIESPAMRGLLTKLRCSDYLTLVAASSIIRPGVARSGMMKAYIQRFHAPDSFQYIHPVMKEQLQETYGVMVYQEDVLKICHHFAGLDLADADVLRRAMSGKHRSKQEFQRIKDKFFANCRSYQYPDDIALEVWRQIESFAGYSFSKAHSASYAVESFQSLFLKTYYPLEFMVGVINNFGGFYRTWVYFNEARRCGATISLPCVNRGKYLTSIQDKIIYIGFVHLLNLESGLANRIVTVREQSGEFASLSDFISRTSPGLEQLILLIRIGAFRYTGKSKSALLWEAHSLLAATKKVENPPALFLAESKEYALPELVNSPLEDAYDEIELLEFPVSLTYFDLLDTAPPDPKSFNGKSFELTRSYLQNAENHLTESPFKNTVLASEMNQKIGKKVIMLGQLVTTKYVRTVKKEIMQFGTFLDVEGAFFDTVHFPPSLKAYPFRGTGVYRIEGKIVAEFGFPSLEVDRMSKLPIKKDPRY
jgi:error-prone DNA polymerase